MSDCPLCSSAIALSDLNIEKAVISAMLCHPEAIEAASSVQPTDFTGYATRVLFEQILALHNAGDAVDVVVLTTHLYQKKLIDAVGGPAFVSECATEGYAYNFKQYIDILKDLSARRQILVISDKIARLARDGVRDESSWRDILPGYLSEVDSIMITGKKSAAKTIKQVAFECIDHMEKQYQASEETDKPISTGIEGLDKLLDGGIRREYVLIGGKSGEGKSLLTMQLAGNLMNAGRRAYIQSYEMRDVILMQRDISRMAGIPLNQVMARVKHENEFVMQKIGRAVMDIQEKWDGLIHDDPNVKFEDLLQAIRAEHRKKPIDLVVVDYLQYIPKNRSLKLQDYQILKYYSDELGRFQRELNCTLIAPLQIDNDGDIKESKAIQDSSQLFIRIEMTEKEDDNGVMAATDEGFLRILKQRFGTKGKSAPVFRNGQFQRLEDREHVSEKPLPNRWSRRK